MTVQILFSFNGTGTILIIDEKLSCKEDISKTIPVQLPRLQASTTSTHYDAVVVGAGPYGLSTAAHLIGKGLKVAIFGKPVSLWHENMPEGMFLRSYWWAINLSDPWKKYQFTQYMQEHDLDPPDHVARETFIDYAQWFQTHAVPNVDVSILPCFGQKAPSLILRECGQWTKSGREELLPRDLLSLGHLHAAEGANGLHGPVHVLAHPLDHTAR